MQTLWDFLVVAFVLWCAWMFFVALTPTKTAKQRYNREFSRVRRDVLARDGYRCQFPGCGARGKGLHVHHKNPRSRGGSNRMSNLVSVCPPCHMRIHGRKF